MPFKLLNYTKLATEIQLSREHCRNSPFLYL